jgi:hypothetical protein
MNQTAVKSRTFGAYWSVHRKPIQRPAELRTMIRHSRPRRQQLVLQARGGHLVLVRPVTPGEAPAFIELPRALQHHVAAVAQPVGGPRAHRAGGAAEQLSREVVAGRSRLAYTSEEKHQQRQQQQQQQCQR